MTLDEAIKDAKTITEESQRVIDNGIMFDLAEYQKTAKNYRQLAEWLKDYKRLLEQEPKIGRWIEEDMFDGDVAYRCSECNELFWIESGTPKDNEYNFCPKCGKRLIKPQESEE